MPFYKLITNLPQHFGLYFKLSAESIEFILSNKFFRQVIISILGYSMDSAGAGLVWN